MSGSTPQSAEWITERTPTNNNNKSLTYPYLAGFETSGSEEETFKDCQVSPNGNTYYSPLDYGSYQEINMYNENHTTMLADPLDFYTGSDGNQAFHDYFDNQGDTFTVAT